MAQTRRISKNNTRIVRHPDGSRGVFLYQTEIVTVRPDGSVRLRTGGWKTSTTRARMNQVANEWGLGYSVSFAGGDFTVRYRGRAYLLGDVDTVTLLADGTVQS